MKWVKPFAIGYEYVYIPDKVINLTVERLLTLSEMIYISIDHATIYCHSRYSMNRKYEYATDKIYNLIGNELYMHRPRNNILSLEI